MWSAPESARFRPQRRPNLELGMTPLIDIVFLLLIFFMLTSRFVVQEGIQVDLPVTDRSHTLPAEKTHRITVRSQGVIVMDGRTMTVGDVELYLRDRDAAYFGTQFEILADRSASVQTVISLLEMLRDKGASRVTLGTERSVEK
ncbi:MAG: biopolymer transporter ExbD [bacterium]|nr:biopolymer transporter ExbD [bacterium]MDT8366302.1 biopolymer transporter ExbD [bacterium]